MFVSISRSKWVGWGGGGVKSKLSQLVYTKSVFIKEVDRTGSVLFETGTFFCTKVIIKAQLLLIQGHYGWMISELKRNFFFVFIFRDKETVFFAWLSVVFLLACVPGKSMTIVWTLTYRCVWKMLRKFLHEIFLLTSWHEHSLTFIINCFTI